MKKQAIDSEGSMDRISELPQHLLHDILCFLSQKEALQTSVLSKLWRYLGSTRPNLDFDERHFYRNKEKLPSVVDKTLQRYHDQKLSLQEFCLTFSGYDSESIPFLEKWIPIVILNMGVKTFHLSFLPNDCDVSLPHVFFKSETLQSLVLCGRILIRTPIDNVILCKNLQTLIFEEVFIENDTLDMILSSCHLIETLALRRCRGLRTIKLDDRIRLKLFEFYRYNDIIQKLHYPSIEINAPTLETLTIAWSPSWFNIRNYLFAHLKSLCLEGVRLSSWSFDSFSSNFPCLEKLSLIDCDGFDEFKLSSRSIKNFIIKYGGDNPLKAVIDAPSLVGFEYRGYDILIPQPISFQATASEWKSKISVLCDMTVDDSVSSLWWLELYEFLKALGKSKISLRILQKFGANVDITKEEEEEDTYGGLCEPVVVERLVLSSEGRPNPSSGFLKNLKKICCARKWASEEETE
ncbi:hypothetical protein CASFOL_013036 [Castilleja foliolosa]|uniref:F-box domain-containing protein n=1 Tax=Castilleja foliolosa TaxID=1961234 RepID=A0ABD3DMX0_9LAMI